MADLGAPCPVGWSTADWALEVLVSKHVPTDVLVSAHADAREEANAAGADKRSTDGRLSDAALIEEEARLAGDRFVRHLA